MRRPLCVFCLAFLMILRLMVFLHPPALPDYQDLDAAEVTVCGQVISKEFSISESGRISLLITLSEPSLQGSNVSFDQKLNIMCRFRASQMQELEEISGRIPVSAHLTAQGRVRIYEPAANHGEFDSAFYNIGILPNAFEVDYAEAVSISSPDSELRASLGRVRSWLSGILQQELGDEDASVMRAILLGERKIVPKELAGIYRESGIIHILAISGLHISMIGAGLYELLRRIRFPIAPAAMAAVIVMMLYGTMVGTGVSTVRALIMFALHMAARLRRRTYDLLTALSIAGALLALQNPLYLNDSGFLFSFSAVAGAALLGPCFPAKLRFLSVPMAVLPVYLQCSYEFPLSSLLVNLAVLPLMSILMAAGLLILFLGTVIPIFAPVPSFVVHLILRTFLLLCDLTSKLPYHSVITGRKAPWMIAAYLAVLLLTALYAGKIPEKIRLLLLAGAILIFTIPQYYGLQIHFMYVGQGDGILITMDEEEAILVDGGSSSELQIGRYTIVPLLKYYGVSLIRAMILTHEDTDHMSGWEDVLDESSFQVERILLPDVAPSCRSENYRNIVKKAEESGIPLSFVGRGDRLQFDHGGKELDLYFLHPGHGASYQNANNGSTVFLLRYGDFTGMFTGDLESGRQEQEVLEAFRQLQRETGREEPVSLLKVAHHGSEGATSREFLEELRPELAVISCGKDNVYGHPHKALLKRLKEAGVRYRITAREGEISLQTER